MLSIQTKELRSHSWLVGTKKYEKFVLPMLWQVAAAQELERVRVRTNCVMQEMGIRPWQLPTPFLLRPLLLLATNGIESTITAQIFQA